MTYYDILEVSQTASMEVIRMAYKALAKKYHPDTYAGEKGFAEYKMKQINEAFDVLSSPEKRGAYNYTLQNASPQYRHEPSRASTTSAKSAASSVPKQNPSQSGTATSSRSSSATKKKSRLLASTTTVLAVLIVILCFYQFHLQKETNVIIDGLNTKIAEQGKRIEERDKAIQLKDSTITSLEKAKINYNFIIKKMRSGKIGYASNNFKVDRGIVILRTTDKSQKIKLTTSFGRSITVGVDYEHSVGSLFSDVAQLKFDEDSWYGGSTTLTVCPYEAGVTVATFSNDINDETFKVLIIVTE